MLTQARLRELLSYNPETGDFVRLVSRPTAKAGDVAGWEDTKGYKRIEIDGRAYQVHRLAWFYVYGVWPKGEIDHINRTPSDNRISNLRDATRSSNQRNVVLRVTNKSGVAGVSWHTSALCWIARGATNGRRKHIGSSTDFFEAVCLRKSWEAANPVFA